MSERAAAFGKKAPAFSVEHNGTTFHFSLAITEGVLCEIEARLYQRAVASLVRLRDAYPLDEYVRRLDELRQAHDRGDYDLMTSPAVQQYLGTTPGQMFLLAIMGGTTERALIPLFLERKEEMASIIGTALGVSLPMKSEADADPKAGRPASQ